jgi:hypothetical protein
MDSDWKAMLQREWDAVMTPTDPREIKFHRFDPDSDCACWACIGRLQLWVIRSQRRTNGYDR